MFLNVKLNNQNLNSFNEILYGYKQNKILSWYKIMCKLEPMNL